ncbi:hypothetical protein ASPNIDRAFT_195006, partial [Aspergillus niger ATCC 1015]
MPEYVKSLRKEQSRTRPLRKEWDSLFSTLPHVSKISCGKYQRVDHFNAKAEM